MTYSKSSHKPSKKGFSDSPTVGVDLLYELSYMSSIATTGLPRREIFELAGQLPCSASQYLREVNLLTNKFRYDYATACRMVGEQVKDETVKSLFLRLSSSLSSGEKETTFFAQEAKTQANAYINDYERRVESLRKWSEAYAAMVVSAALIVMVAAVSMLIYPVGMGFIIALTCITIAVGVIGAWMVYISSPKEMKIHAGTSFCSSQNRTRLLEKILIPVAAVTLVALLIARVELGWILIVTSSMLVPVGISSIFFERQVSKKDRDISTLLRSLGNISSATGIPISNAISRLDVRSTAALIPDVKRLRSRIASKIRPDLCWQRFAVESGSELIYRSVRMFHDATRLGGDPEAVGERSSILAQSMEFLRAKRGQVSSSFNFLAMGIHASLVALLVFVTQIVTTFGTLVAGVYQDAVAGAPNRSLDVFGFNFQNVGILNTLTLPCLLVLAGATAFAVNATEGGSRQRLYLYMAITFGMSGIAMVAVPQVTHMLFSTISIK
jgi:archaeal flagellar protein FlaJ